jgi:hypothetical protein
MKEYNNSNNRKYVKVCKESGCISANYSTENEEEEMTVITYENNEMSGSIKYSNVKRNR